MNAEKTIRETEYTQPKEQKINQPKTFKEYTVIKEIEAQGTEADIFLLEKEQVFYILKLYRRGISINKELIEKIKEISKNNPHIISTVEYGFDAESGKHYEILEFAQYGTIDRLFTEKPINRNQLKNVVKQINEALHDLHRNGIIHRDLKPSNIMVKSINPLIVSVSDFGTSSHIDSEMTKKITSIKGTPMYHAPESFSGIVGKEVDYWALGIIILELLHKNPFKGLNQKTIMFKITSESVTVAEDIDESIKKLIKGLLTQNRKQRWGYKQVKNWLEGKENKLFYSYKDTSGKYTYINKNFESLEQLVKYISKNEQNYKPFLIFVKKEYLSQQLRKNNEVEKDIEIYQAVENEEDELLLLIKIIKTLAPYTIPRIHNTELSAEGIIKLLLENEKKNGKISDGKREIISIIQKKDKRERLLKYLNDKKIEKALKIYFHVLYKTKNKLEAVKHSATFINNKFITPENYIKLIKNNELISVAKHPIEKEKLEKLNIVLRETNNEEITEKTVKNLNTAEYLKLSSLLNNIPEEIDREKTRKEIEKLKAIKLENKIYPEGIEDAFNKKDQFSIIEKARKTVQIIKLIKEKFQPIEAKELQNLKEIYNKLERNGYLPPYELEFVVKEKPTLHNWLVYLRNFKKAKNFLKENTETQRGK